MAKKTLSLAEEYDIYLANTVTFPGLLGHLQQALGDNISLEAIQNAGIGYHPSKHAWVFPERNYTGTVVGFTYRNIDTGDKWCVTGGKRGLAYTYNQHYAKSTAFKPGAHNWVRTTESLPCPICGKTKYCMLDKSNPIDPAVVLCTKIGRGSLRMVSTGWIHELKPHGDKCGREGTVLCDTEHPYFIVEGGSDPIALESIGLVGVGKPSNTGGTHNLRKVMPRGHPIVVIGENDRQTNVSGKEIWPGYDGALKTCVELRDIAPIKLLMPPDGVKDMRAWVNRGLTSAEFLTYVQDNAKSMSTMPESVFETDDPLHITDKFLQNRFMQDDTLILRDFRGLWLRWDGDRYKELTKAVLRGSMYSFLEGTQAVCTGPTGDPVVKPLKTSARRISDMMDALSRWCPVTQDMPCWLDGAENMPRVDSLIAFKNGLLDVDEYCKGRIVLHKPDPRLFSTFALPYDFDENARSPRAETFLEDVFEADEERLRLVQQWFGYNLVPDTHMQKFMLFIGVPRSGKSTLIEMMQHMVGPDQCCAIRFEDLASEFGRQPLLGKQCCFIGDTRSPGRAVAGLSMEQLLRIVGEDTVCVNRKRIDALGSVQLKTRFTFAMNELPFFIDNSNALASRMLIANFNKSYIGREDYALRGLLRNEAREGKLMNWALDGLRHLRSTGRFIEPEIARATMTEFIELASPVASFVKECCVLDKANRETKDKLYDTWKGWAEDNGYSPGVKVHFGRKLSTAVAGRVTPGRMKSGDKDHAYVGIRLTERAMEKYLGGR
jgi:putative DNA primase/helicase